MPEPSPKPLSGGEQSRASRRIDEPFYAVTWGQAQYDYQDGILTPRGLIYLYFRTHLKPGAETQINVDDLCETLGIHEATYYRAIGALKGRKRLNIRRGQMTVGIPEITAQYAQSQSCESNSQLCESNSQDCDSNSQICDSDSQSCENGNQVNALSVTVSRKSANVPNRSTDLKDLNKQLVPPTHPVDPGIDKEGIGTDPPAPNTPIAQQWQPDEWEPQDPLEVEVATLLNVVREAGLNPNKTISKTIADLLLVQGSAAAATIVRNAVSALEEQQIKGKVRNPSGFLVSALRKGYTGNRHKQQVRGKDQPQPQPESGVDLGWAIAAIQIHAPRLGLNYAQAIAQHLDSPKTKLNQLTDFELIQLATTLEQL